MKGLDNNKCLLIYGFNQDEKEKLEKIKEEEGLGKIIEITDTMTSMTVRNLIDGLHLEVLAKALPQEKVILFNNLSDKELEASIKSIRGSVEVIYFCNSYANLYRMDFADLFEHLIEREFLETDRNEGRWVSRVAEKIKSIARSWYEPKAPS